MGTPVDGFVQGAWGPEAGGPDWLHPLRELWAGPVQTAFCNTRSLEQCQGRSSCCLSPRRLSFLHLVPPAKRHGFQPWMLRRLSWVGVGSRGPFQGGQFLVCLSLRPEDILNPPLHVVCTAPGPQQETFLRSSDQNGQKSSLRQLLQEVGQDHEPKVCEKHQSGPFSALSRTSSRSRLAAPLPFPFPFTLLEAYSVLALVLHCRDLPSIAPDPPTGAFFLSST